MDHKSTAILGGGKTKNLLLDWQVQMYPILVNRCHDSPYLVEFFCYNQIRKPQIRIRKNETHEEFCCRLKNEYLKNPDRYFRRKYVTCSDHDQDKAFYDVDLLSSNLLWYYQRARNLGGDTGVLDATNWPKNPDYCFKFSSEVGCRFWPICAYGFEVLDKTRLIENTGIDRGNIIKEEG